MASGSFDLTEVLRQVESMSDFIDAHEAFGRRAEGWIRVDDKPAATRSRAKQQESPARPLVEHEQEARA